MKKIVQRPLPVGFLLIGLLLAIGSLVYLSSGKLSPTYGTLGVILGIIFVAGSLKSLELFE